MSDYQYEGSELALFRSATNWKNYFSRKLAPFITGDVLEVGAGLGGTTEIFLRTPELKAKSWLCLEPDESLRKQIPLEHLKNLLSGAKVESRGGFLATMEKETLFDTLLYIDVLEHIENDKAELELAKKHLRPGGRLVILGPAHNSLMNEFDKAVGHQRRYSVQDLRKILPEGMEVVSAGYLDSVGFFASLANSLVLKKAQPSEKDVLFWDKMLVPISRVTDRITLGKFGKTSYIVAQKVR